MRTQKIGADAFAALSAEYKQLNKELENAYSRVFAGVDTAAIGQRNYKRIESRMDNIRIEQHNLASKWSK